MFVYLQGKLQLCSKWC